MADGNQKGDGVLPGLTPEQAAAIGDKQAQREFLDAHGPQDGSAGSVPQGEMTAATNANLDHENALINYDPSSGQPAPQAPDIVTGKGGIQTTYNGETTGHHGAMYGGSPDQEPSPTFAPRPYEGPVTHTNDEDAHLFGAGGASNQAYARGSRAVPHSFSPPPRGSEQWYTALRAAAKDPEAPPSIHELFGLVNGMLSSQYSTQPYGGDRVSSQFGALNVGGFIGATAQPGIGGQQYIDGQPVGGSIPPPSQGQVNQQDREIAAGQGSVTAVPADQFPGQAAAPAPTARPTERTGF